MVLLVARMGMITVVVAVKLNGTCITVMISVLDRSLMHRAENPANVRRAVSVVERISKQYSDPSYYGVITSLAMLNEPATYLNNNLLQVTRQYWYDAYGAARYPWAKDGRSDKSGLALIISDGFQPLDTFKDYMKEPEHEGVSQIFPSPAVVRWGENGSGRGQECIMVEDVLGRLRVGTG